MGQAKKRGSIEERTAKAIEAQQAKAAEQKIEEQEAEPRGRGSRGYMQLALMAAAMSLPSERPITEMTLTNIHHPDFPERPRKKKFERRRP